MAGIRGVGDWIGKRFEIFDVFEGGMSIVYVVHDHLKKSGVAVVALKTLRDELIGNRIRRSRFATECRLWVQLGHHPNIVQLIDSGRAADGSLYTVFSFAPGDTLADLLARLRAVARGLKVRPWVKTSLAPGSKVVTGYLDRAGLTPYLDQLGFNLTGYGCTTCIGNSGPLPAHVGREAGKSVSILLIAAIDPEQVSSDRVL